MSSELPEVPPLRPVRPWDLFNKNKERVPAHIKEERLAFCKECPFFINITGQCKKCGCFMDSKTKLSDATCPIGKWGMYFNDPKLIPFKEEL
jgi:hypothetical protein